MCFYFLILCLKAIYMVLHLQNQLYLNQPSLGVCAFKKKSQNQKPTSQELGSSTEPNYRNIFPLTLTILFSTVKNNKWKILETYVYNKGKPRRIGHK